MTVDLATIVGILLSAGGGAFVLAVVKGLQDMRSGARTGQREVVQDLMAWRDDIEAKLRLSEKDRDWWRDLAARRGEQLRLASIEPAEPDPVPPSERLPREHRRRRDTTT